ncbi:MAG: pitrilysin family protein [Pseudomonadota bacterium]
MTVRVSTLANGLRVASDPMASVESVSLGVWVGAGTRYETPEVNGVAHLLEHMVFKGTRRRNAQQIAEEIEAVGGHLNAYTSRETTAYYAKVLKDDADLALDMVADLLQHATLDETELKREREVVIQEIGQAHDTPDDVVFDHFQAAAFPDQPIGRPVLGTTDVVGHLDRADVARYRGGHYGADAMVLVAAGNVDHDWLVERADTLFADLEPCDQQATSPAAYEGGEFRQDRDLEQLHMLLGFPGISYHDPEFYATSVLSMLLGGGMSSRLFQEIREKRGLVYSVYSFTSAYSDGGLFGIYAGTGGDETAELIPVLCDEIATVAKTVSDEEVARARAQLKASQLMGLESTSGRCEQLGNQMLIFNRPLPVAETVAKIDAVDAQAVANAAQRLFTGRPTLAALGQVGKLESYDRIAARLG